VDVDEVEDGMPSGSSDLQATRNAIAARLQLLNFHKLSQQRTTLAEAKPFGVECGVWSQEETGFSTSLGKT